MATYDLHAVALLCKNKTSFDPSALQKFFLLRDEYRGIVSNSQLCYTYPENHSRLPLDNLKKLRQELFQKIFAMSVSIPLIAALVMGCRYEHKFHP